MSKFSFGFEALKSDPTMGVEVSAMELHAAERDVQQFAQELTAELDREEQIEMLTAIGTQLKDLKEEDTSLLKFMTPSLEEAGIDCTSNETAQAGVTALVEKVASDEVSTEAVGVSFLIGVAVAFILLSAYSTAYDAIVGYAVVLQSQLAKLKLKPLDAKKLEEGGVGYDDYIEGFNIVSFKQFSTLISAFTKCYSIFGAKAKSFDAKAFDEIKAVMKGIGIVMDNKGRFEDNEKFDSTDVSPKDAGWNVPNCKKAIAMMEQLDTEMLKFKGYVKEAKKAAAELKKSSKKKEDATDEEKVEAKDKAAELKLTVKGMKTFVSYTTDTVKQHMNDLKLVCSLSQ